MAQGCSLGSGLFSGLSYSVYRIRRYTCPRLCAPVSAPSSPPLIRASIQQLGFKITDVKILLISHAHIDHDAGSAQILKWTHAKYMVMDGDVGVVQSGGRTDFAYPDDRYR